jgi:hypothetical protein
MNYKRALTVLSAAMIAGAVYAPPSFAQSYGGERYASSDRDWNRGDSASARWDRFLEQNPDFARRFHGNPNIIRDLRVMDDQPGVREFFANNPDVRDYVYRTTHNDSDSDDSASAKWNRFLERNPNFAERYRQNPDIVRNDSVMRDEPEVREFLRTNPDVRGYVMNGGGAGWSRSSRLSAADEEDMRADSGFDAYLANHPNLAKQLHNNPSLINDREFVKAHPNPHEYLRNHPEARY